MNIDVDAYLDDTGCKASMLYDMLRDVIDDGKDILKGGALVEKAHRLRGALVQLYVNGPIVEHLTGVTPSNVAERSKVVLNDLNEIAYLLDS